MLQNRGHLTAMTGDGERFTDFTRFWLIELGVNDAPSLKRVGSFLVRCYSSWSNLSRPTVVSQSKAPLMLLAALRYAFFCSLDMRSF